MVMTVTETIGDRESASAPLRQSSWLPTFAKIGFSATTFGAILYVVDLPGTWARMAGQNLQLAGLALAIIVVQIILGSLRWHVILAKLGGRSTVADSLRVFYASVFFNAFFIGAVGGDIMRVWLAYRARVDAVVSVHSVILDRVAALAGIGLLVIFTAPLFIARIGTGLPAFLPIGLASLGLVAIAAGAQLDRMPESWMRLRALHLLRALAGAVRRVFLDPVSAAPVLAFAVAAQAAMALSAFAIASSLNIGVSLIDCLVLMQPVALLTALPISIGGWGVRETAMIGLFGMIGVPTNAALALSVQIGLLTIVASLPGCAVWLVLRRKAPAESFGGHHAVIDAVRS